MIIKKFTAKDSRSVMDQVRQEFGPDAILLSSKSVGDHFEMVATPGYNDQDIEMELSGETAAKRREQERLLREQERLQREQDNLQLEEQRRLREAQLLDQMQSAHQQSIESMQEEIARLRELMELQIRASVAQPSSQIPLSALGNLQEVPKQDPARDRQEDPRPHIDRALAQIGMSKRLRASLTKRLEGVDRMEVASSKTMKLLSSAVKEMPLGLFPREGMAAFMGREGAGKTTALIKIAQGHRKRYGSDSIGLVIFGKSMTNLGLKKYATALNISLIEAQSSRQLVSAVKRLSSKQLVLIDCQGMDQPNAVLGKGLRALKERYPALLSFLTIPADTRPEQQELETQAYSDLQPSMLISMFDRPRYLGCLVELLIRKKMPLAYISKNRKLDGDIVRGKSEELIRAALDLGKLPEETPTAQLEWFEQELDLVG